MPLPSNPSPTYQPTQTPKPQTPHPQKVHEVRTEQGAVRLLPRKPQQRRRRVHRLRCQARLRHARRVRGVLLLRRQRRALLQLPLVQPGRHLPRYACARAARRAELLGRDRPNALRHLLDGDGLGGRVQGVRPVLQELRRRTRRVPELQLRLRVRAPWGGDWGGAGAGAWAGEGWAPPPAPAPAGAAPPSALAAREPHPAPSSALSHT
jgi:hypothetical protein